MWLDPGREKYLDALVRANQIKEVMRAINEEKYTGKFTYPKHINKARFRAMMNHIKTNGIA